MRRWIDFRWCARNKSMHVPGEFLWVNVQLKEGIEMSSSDNSSAVITNEFRQQTHFHANQSHFPSNQSHFHKKGFALRLALKQRHKGTRKWPIECLLAMESLFESSTSFLPGLSVRGEWNSITKKSTTKHHRLYNVAKRSCTQVCVERVVYPPASYTRLPLSRAPPYPPY